MTKVNTPQEWLNSVAEALEVKDVSLDGLAKRLNKEGVSGNTIKDYVTVYTGAVIKGMDLAKVKDIVRGKRKSVTTSGVHTALKELNVDESLLIPSGRRGRSAGPAILNNDSILSLFGDLEQVEDSETEDSSENAEN